MMAPIATTDQLRSLQSSIVNMTGEDLAPRFRERRRRHNDPSLPAVLVAVAGPFTEDHDRNKKGEVKHLCFNITNAEEKKKMNRVYIRNLWRGSRSLSSSFIGHEW